MKYICESVRVLTKLYPWLEVHLEKKCIFASCAYAAFPVECMHVPSFSLYLCIIKRYFLKDQQVTQHF